MTMQAALTAGEYTAIRGNYYGPQVIVLNDNTVVFKGQVNQSSFGVSVAQVTFDGVTVGAYTDAEIGMAVFFSHSDDIRAAYHVGRVRKAATSSILYIDETSEDLQDNDYFFVVEDWREMEKLATAEPYRKDWDLTFDELDPIITDLATVYAGKVTGSPAGFTQRFNPTLIAATSGASISSVAFTIASGMTVTAGNENTDDVTIRFDEGKHWLELVVTDSGGRTATRRIWVIAYPEALTSVVEQGFAGAAITCDWDSGWSATVKAFDGISNVLDNTLCAVIDISFYNDTETIIDSNIAYVGRLRTESGDTTTDESYGLLSEVSFDIKSPHALLGRLKSQAIDILHDTTPTAWDQINNATYWRAITHLLQTHSTFLTTHSLWFGDTSNDSLMDIWAVGGSDMLSEVNGLAEDWVSNVEFHPDGRMFVGQRANQLDTAGRNALPQNDFTAQDYLTLNYQHEHVKTVAVVNGNGGVYNTSTDKVGAYLSKAPGEASGEGDSVGPFPGQVLTANQNRAAGQAELDARLGNALAEQNPTPVLSVTHPDGYGFILPSRRLWFTWTLGEDDLMKRGVSYDTSTRWLAQSVAYTHDNDAGRKTCEVIYVQETEGQPGQEQDESGSTGVDIVIPAIPPMPAYPVFPPPQLTDPPPFYQEPVVPGPEPGIEGVPNDGNAIFFGTGAGASAPGAWITQELLKAGSPEQIEVTPSTLPDGYIIKHGVTGFGLEAYLLASDGTDSILYYTENLWTTSRVWVQNDTISGAYDLIRLGPTQGEVYLYSQSVGGAEDYDDDYWLSEEYAFSFTFSAEGGFKSIDIDAYAGAVGFYLDYSTAGPNANDFRWDNVGLLADSITQFNGFFPGGANQQASFYDTGLGSYDWDPPYTRLTFANLTTMTTSSPPKFYVGTTGGSITGTFVGTLRVIIEKATQPFPGAGGGLAKTVYSSDYGVSFASPETVGSPPVGAFGGMDTIKIGDLVLAGSDEQVASAQSGGAYSAYGVAMESSTSPGAILIPRAHLDSISDNNGGTTTPDYLLASDVLSATNAALWTVVNSGADFTDITPYDGSNYGLATGPNCLAMSWRSGKTIAVVLLFGSLPKLYWSDDTGATWSSRGVLGANACALTFRKGDADLVELYGVDDTNVWYSDNEGVTLTTKVTPASDPLKWISVYG